MRMVPGAFNPRVWLVFLLALQTATVIAQPGTKKFSQLTTTDGLSQGTVNCILKDKYGFMWFGTQDGLNKYDGISFTIYRNNPKKPGSIPDNQIKCIVEDSLSNLWIGTLGGGLCYYDRNRDSFYTPSDLGFQSDRTVDPAVLSMYLDRQGRLWAGTFQDLLLIDRTHKKIRHFIADPASPAALSNGIIQCIFQDSRDRLWIGTAHGLNLLQDSTHGSFRFLHYTHIDSQPSSLSNDQVLSIMEDQHRRLWVGTLGGGLNGLQLPAAGMPGPLKTSLQFTHYSRTTPALNAISGNVVRSLTPADSSNIWVGTEDALDLFNTSSGQFTHYQKTLTGTGSLSNNTILSLLLDNTGILWAGTAEGGINKFDPNLFLFDVYRKTSDPNSLNTDIVTSFAETPDGDCWIGTDGGGLNRWQQRAGRFIHYLPTPGTTGSINSASILSLLVDRKKEFLWIGTFGGGLNRLDLHTGKFHYYRAGPGIHDLSNDAIYALLEDADGRIWIGTNGGGVNVLDPRSGSIIKHHPSNLPDSVGNDYIRCMLRDKQDRIWIGTYSSGISVYDPATGKFILYDKLNNHLSNQVVFSLCEDAHGNIWAGTMGGGLDRFDAQQRRFIPFNEDNGLGNNIVNAIIEDEKGNLWLSTNKGISRFDPYTKKFRNYGLHNGVQNPEFSIGAGYRTTNGRILFGGVNGFNVFNPGEVMDNKIAPVTRFTGFLLKNAPLKGDLNSIRKISLTHDQSDFTIHYAALSYTVPQESRYSYILDGFDRTWTNAGPENHATYTNIPPGSYTFRIKAANNDGVWSDRETTLHIHISPPFWDTWWAWTLYILLAAGLLYFIYRDIATREQLKAQIRLERMTADQMKELNRIKLNFFTNVSHELRTPLSLIMDPLRKITSETLSTRQIQQYGALMYNNAQRLMKLIDQMLDLRRLEAGHDQLAARPADIVMITRNIAALFDMHAVERNINYAVTSSKAEIIAPVDQDKYEKIIFNLISNAFKYTPDGGSIAIQLTLPASEKDYLAIHVMDTGIGIPSHLKEKVFEIFYQVEGASRFERGSTGIGLALTKELIALHKGRVEVESQPGKGSDFIIYLPLAGSLSHPGNGQPASVSTLIPVMPSIPAPDLSTPMDDNIPLLLLVEDNIDLRTYLGNELKNYYKVESAPDGLTGYETALQIVPDLVISDIMMPGLNGLELCEKLKTDERTSHIPVILLTARQADIHQIEGYIAGADAYIPKPFNMDLVLARIKNLLDSRRALRERYTSLISSSLPATASPSPDSSRTITDSPQSPSVESSTPVVTQMHPLDKAFLEKAADAIHRHLSDITFDTDTLADKLKVSRRQLYRKIKALTDQTVHEFVTDIRLNTAMTLLTSGEFTIAEVAFRVGYSEPANFTRSFTRRYGMSPKKFIAAQQ